MTNWMQDWEAERLAINRAELAAEDAAKAAKLAAMTPAEREAYEAANSYEAKFGHLDDLPDDDGEDDDCEDESDDDA